VLRDPHPRARLMTGALQPGDIGLASISGDVGALIRVGQFLNGSGFSRYEHAFVYIGDGLIVEAEPGGARCVPLHYGDAYWCRFTPTAAQRAAIVMAARGYAQARVPYGFADYAALAARRLHVPVPGLRQRIESAGSMICSQLADRCYQDAGYQICNDGRWAGYVTPGDIYLASEAVPGPGALPLG
jgi:hypothetical protein